MKEFFTERGLSFLQETPEEQLRDWLFRGFRENSFHPVLTLRGRSYQDQIRSLFTLSSVEVQNKLKAAVVRAVLEHDVDSHGWSVLRDLCLLACELGASDVVKVLRHRLKVGLIQHAEHEECCEALRGIVIVLARFAPLEEAQETLKYLLFDEQFSARFAGSLVASLCRLNGEDYPLYVPRLREVVERYPQNYILKEATRELVRVITPAVIGEHLEKLEEPTQSWFRSLLLEHAPEHFPVPLMLEVGDDELYVLDPLGGGRPIAEAALKVTQRELERPEKFLDDIVVRIGMDGPAAGANASPGESG